MSLILISWIIPGISNITTTIKPTLISSSTIEGISFTPTPISQVAIRNGGKSQGFVFLGDSNLILKSFQESARQLNVSNDLNFQIFNENPNKLLEFIYALYNQPNQYDKKSNISKILITQDNKNNKDIPKNFFKGFKSTKDDPKNLIIVSNLDDYIETESDFFTVINTIIKDLQKKKLNIALLLQFNSKRLLGLVKSKLELDFIEFENVFKSRIVSEPDSKPIEASSSKNLPQTLDLEKEEEIDYSSSIEPIKTVITDKLTKASAIFTEPEIKRDPIRKDTAYVDKQFKLFISLLNSLQAEISAEIAPNANMIKFFVQIFEIDVINSSPKDLKGIIDPLEHLIQSYFTKGASTLGSSLPLSRILYKILKITGKKQERYEFVKHVADTLLSFERNDYALEFLDLALAISNSKEDAEITTKHYLNIADTTSNTFIKKSHLYKAIAAAYISENSFIIEQLKESSEKFSTSLTPFF